MKDKHLFFLMVPVFLVLTIFATYMAVTASNGPIKLTSEEIAFYEESATAYLNHEKVSYISNSNETLRYIPGKDKVTVASNNIFKETVTAYNENGQTFTKVNAPNVSFTGCIVFHSIISVATLGICVFFLVSAIDECRISSKQKAR